MKKIALRVLALLAVVGASVGGWFIYQAATRPPELTYRTVKVERGRIVARITATGTLSAHVTVQVGSQVSGRLAQIFVDYNSPVKKGQVIAKIDPQLFEAAVAQARANAYAAQGNLAKAKAQALDAERKEARAKSLHAEGILSKADLDTAETDVAVARAQIEAAKGAVEQARAAQHQADINLAYTTIVSPIDGIVISRTVDVGQTVAASLQAPTLFTIAEDLRQMQVDTNIAEGDVGKIRPDMTATFVVDAYPNQRFKGTIRQIRNAAQTVQNVVTYDAVIDVDNAGLELKPGMTANVTVVYAQKDEVLKVPNAALRFRPPPALAGSASATVARRDQAMSGPQDAPAGPEEPRRKRGARAWGSATPVAASGSGAPPAASGSAPPALPQGEPPRAREGSSDRKSVWVLRGPKPEQVQVRTGLTDGTVTELVEGELVEGDALVTEAMSGDEPVPASTSKAGGSGPPRMRL